MSRLIDLSHPIEQGMITYKGLPGPEIDEYMSRESSRDKYADGATFHIGRITMIANTGTYVDSPFHRFENAVDMAGLPLENLADLPARVFDLPESTRAVEPDLFGGEDLKGHAVLIRTGWDRHWRTDQYSEGNPYVTRAAAEYLVAQNIALAGIDSLNIDDPADLTRPAHTLLLEAGIPVCEHLCNLKALPASGSRFFAVPAPVKGLGTFPVRAFALLEE
ncbi:MAG: cyclase family protein [Acidobacteriota bacterium]|nr:cyclase family protein [Acidobacteriota bacterium]